MENGQENRKNKILLVKKRNLFILMIVCALVGGVVSSGLNFAVGVATNRIPISKAEYEDYKQVKQKYGKLAELQEIIEERYYIPVDEEQLYLGIYKGLFAGIGDPYSAYLTASEYEDLMISATGEYQGIGVTIGPDENGYINVVAPTDGSPAHKAGIRAGDKIVKVDDVDYDADTMDAAVSAMRGEAGTKVSVTILRNGETQTFEMKRDNIVNKTVSTKVFDGDIGYIRISSFEDHTSEDFTNALKEMESQNVKGFILDLRANGGGIVDAGVSVADQLLDEGIITYTENRKGEKEYHKSKAGKTSLPYIVLVDGGTASASEIVTAAIKDHGAAKLVGTKTYGKGIIQEIQGLKGGDAMKLTIMQYFSPDGNVIHEIGIEPDYEVELPELTDDDYGEDGYLKEERDLQLQKALELMR